MRNCPLYIFFLRQGTDNNVEKPQEIGNNDKELTFVLITCYVTKLAETKNCFSKIICYLILVKQFLHKLIKNAYYTYGI